MRAAASSHAHGRLASAGAGLPLLTAHVSRRSSPLSIDQSANGTAPPPAPARPERQEHVPAAIGLMLGATFVFTCTSALSKWLIETYPIGEVLFSRVFIPLIGLSIIILPRTGLAVFHTKRLKGHLLRGASQSMLADVPDDRVLADAARQRGRDQFLGADLRDARLDDLPAGACRVCALVGDPGGLLRRTDRDQPGHRHLHDRRAVRARERRDVRHPDGRRARADRDRVDAHADACIRC